MVSERDQLREELNDAILWEYDLPAVKAKTVSDGYKVETVRGSKLLKAARASEEEVLLANDAVEYLHRRGFTPAQRFIPTKFGDPLVKVGEQVYYLVDDLDGKSYDLSKLPHLVNSARLLAQMQRAAAGFCPDKVPDSRDRRGQWSQLFAQRVKDLERCRSIASEKLFLTEFDQIFIDQIDGALQQAGLSLEVMESPDYREVEEKEREAGGVCHHDFTSHNLIRRKRQWHVTGYEGCYLDNRFYDLGRLLLRYLPRYNWDGEVLARLLSVYGENQPLSQAERRVLWSYLNFPHRFWRTARQQYLEGEAAESRLTRSMQDQIMKRQEYQEFLAQLPGRLEIT